MGKNDVHIKMTANSADAVNAWRQIIGVVNETNRSIQKLTQQAAANQRATSRGFRQNRQELTFFQRGLRSLVGAWGGMEVGRRALDVLIRQWQTYKQVQEEALEATLTFEQAMAGVVFKMPADSDMTAAEVAQRIRDLQSPVDKGLIAQMVGAAFSTKGAQTSISEALSIALTWVKTRPDLAASPDTMQAMITASLAIQKQFPEMTPTQIMGLVTFGLAEARQDDPKKFAQNIAGGVSKLGKQGVPAREAMAFLAATGTSADEEYGQITQTGAVNFFSQLSERAFAATGDPRNTGWGAVAWLQSGDVRAEQVKQDLLGWIELKRLAELELSAEGAGMSLGELMALPEEAFKEKLTARAKLFPTFAEFIQGGQVYDEFLTIMGRMPEGRAGWEQFIGERTQAVSGTSPVMRQEQITRSALNQFRANQVRAMREQIADSLNEIRKQMGEEFLSRQVLWARDVGNLRAMDNIEDMQRYGIEEANRIAHGLQMFPHEMVQPFGSQQVRQAWRWMFGEQERGGEIIQDFIDKLNDQIESQQRIAEIIEQNSSPERVQKVQVVDPGAPPSDVTTTPASSEQLQ